MADAMRCIFDQSLNLYQRYFQQPQQQQPLNDSSIMDQMSEEEKAWRMSLKEGSLIDAFKTDLSTDFKCWAKAKIVQCIGDGSYFKVQFENDSPRVNRDFARYSLEITQYNTMSEGDEWRKELKEGNLIDALEQSRIWYGSTIIAREIRTEEDVEVLYLKVGYRIAHPQGNKLDDNKQTFFGWSERFDEFLPAYSPRIQKFQSIAKNYEQQAMSTTSTKHEEPLDDNVDVLLYSKCFLTPSYALVRKRCQSNLLVSFLNKFGEIGGFNLIIERIKERGEDTMGLDTLFYYIDCLANSSIMLNKSFLKEYLPQLENEVKQKILTATEQQLRNIRKDRIDGISQSLFGILFQRIATNNQIQQAKDLFNFEIGIMFLEQNFLEKRIEGARLIQDLCKSLNTSTFLTSSETVQNNCLKQLQMQFLTEMISRIKNKNVLYQIFSKERGHLQLVQRSEALLKILMSQNTLNDEELELIWGATKIDEQTKLELYKVLNEISSRMRSSDIAFIIEKLTNTKLQFVISEEIELVHELSKRSKSGETQYGDLAVQYMWKIAFQNEDKVDKSLVNQAAIALTEIIKNWQNEHKLVYVEQIVQNLKQNIEGFLSIKMLRMIFKEFTGSPEKKQEPENSQQQDMVVDNENYKFQSKSIFIEYIEKNYDLLNSFFSNFKNYLDKANDNIQQKLNENSNFEVNLLSDKCIAEKFIHSEQLSERLEFIKFIGCNTSVKITKEQISFLYEYLVLKSLLLSDKEMFYTWLREVCDLLCQYNSIVELNDLIQFFKDNEQKSKIAFQHLSVEGFNCIQSFVLLLNEVSGAIIRMNGSSQNAQSSIKLTSYSNAQGSTYTSYSFNQNKGGQSSTDPDDIEIQVQINPYQLEGLQGLWIIATKSNDKNVSDKACQLLIKLFTCVSYSLENNIPEFEDNFIQTCISGIEEQYKLIRQRQEEEKEELVRVQKQLSAFSSTSVVQKILPLEERRILKYLSMIKELIKNSEKDGTRDVKPHAALFKGELLKYITVQNNLKQGIKYVNKIEFPCYSNTTIWELKKIIGEKISRTNNQDGSYNQEAPCHPGTIRLYRYAGSLDIKDADNGKTLSEMKFKPNEQLTAFKKNIYCQNKAPLLSQNRTQLSEQIKSIFIEWFNIYSEEDMQNPGIRYMTPKTCAHFTRSCTDDLCTEDDSRVIGFFMLYDQDKDGKVTLEEFLQFYLKSCQEKEEVVRQNLLAHGYKYDLKKYPSDGSDSNILQIRPTKNDMPRYKISNNQEWFNIFMQLLEHQGEVSNQAWNLITMLTTNPSLYEKVQLLNNSPNFKWEGIFDQSSIYKMLYTIQIIESFLEENQDEDNIKIDWIERFLISGGFQEIQKLFHNALNLLSGKQVDTLNKYEKNFLEYMLKMIRIFMMAAFSNSDSGIQEVMTLVRKGSSMMELPAVKQDEKTSQSQQNNNDQFKTPSKQVKGKFVQDKNLHIDTGFQPKITQEFLFGEGEEKQAETHEDKENNIKEEKDSQQKQLESEQRQIEESQKCSKLSTIIQNSGLAEFILDQIDFKDLQSQVLEVICLILAKKEILIEDKQIIENSLSLWLVLLMKNENLIEEFYKFQRSQEKAGMFGIKNAEQFITTGIYCYKNSRVRDEFCNTIICISQKVKSSNGVPFLIYALNLLMNNFPRDDQYYTTRECQQFFELFQGLIEEYFKNDSSDKIDGIALLKEVVQRLKRYDSKEKKSSYFEDMTLIGYLNLIEKLINNLAIRDKQRMLEVLNENNFLDEIFYRHLFLNPNKVGQEQENKCKTKESRVVAFIVLQKYMEKLEPHQLADYLEDYIWPLIENLQRPNKWKYTASENSKQYNFSGMVNLGFICYMNSMLQQFFMVPQFRYQLLKAIDNIPIDLVEYKGLKIDDNLLRQLQRMFGYLELTERHAYDPTEFCFAFKDFEGNPTNISLQQDTHEFANLFFDRIEELLKPTSQKHLLEDIFGGKFCSQLICQSCGNIRNILENFYYLSLPVKDRKGMEESLQKMIEGSLINDYFCENCQQRVDVSKRNLIGKTPNVLIVHLQRIIFNFDTFQNDKVNTRFEFPSILDLKNFSFKSVMQQEGRSLDQMQVGETDSLMDVEDDEYIYKLVGVTIHVGTAEQGHYYSLINTKRGKEEADVNSSEWQQTEKDPWKVFDDDKISPYLYSEMKIDCFGGNASGNMNDKELDAYLTHNGNSSYGKNAYMLVYERKKKSDLKEIIVEKEDVKMEMEQDNKLTDQSATLECVDTATSRAAEDIKASSVDIGSNAIQQKSGINMIPYKQVQPYIPEWISSMIKQDNAEFLKDKLIYHESFFNMLKSIFKHIANNVLYTQHQYSYEHVKHFLRIKKTTMNIARKSMFDLLSRYYYNIQMSDITTSFGSIIQFCDSHISLQKGDDSILLKFINDAYLNDNCQYFLNLMFTCPDKTSRYYIGRMTSMIINKAYQIYKDADNKEHPKIIELREAVDRLVHIIVTILSSSECQKNWSRLENYLKMIQEIGMGGSYQSQFLLTKYDIIVVLIDFMLGNKSPIAIQKGEKRPNMDSSQDNPPFEPLVALVCYLIRFTMTPEMKNEEPFWDEQNNLPPPTLLGYNIKEDRGQTEKYPLSETAMIFFTNTDFINKVLKEGYECEELGKALAHFCYKNEKFSKNVAKMLLKGISNNDYEKVKNYLDVVTQVAIIKDELQRVRLEWIFGFGTLSYQTPYNQQQKDKSIQIGVQGLNYLNDEAYQFKSSLIFDSNDDALLHLLWRYKGRIDTYTINCLYSLVNLIALDETVALYFSQLPGPTYCFARYTDWIKPYLFEQLLDARKGYQGSLSANKEEVIAKTLSLYQKYEEYLQFKDQMVPQVKEANLLVQEKMQSDQMEVDQDEENIKNLISEKGKEQQNNQNKEEIQVIQCQPQSYIIIECVGESVIREQELDGVTFTTSQLSCFYTMSQPTGKNNLSIPSNLFKKSQKQYNYAKVYSNNNAEKEMQSNYINNYFQSSHFKQKQENMENKGTDLNSLKKRVIQDDDEQWNIQKMNVSDIDNEENDEIDEEEMKQDDHQQEKQYSDNQEYNQQQDCNIYQIKVVEEGQEGPQEILNGEPQMHQVANQERDMQMNQEDQIDNDQENIQWPCEVDFCEDLVYKFQVQNNRDSTIKVFLKFTQNDENEINLQWPRGGLKMTLFSRSAQTLILLPKIKPTEPMNICELDKLAINFQWKEKYPINKLQAYPSSISNIAVLQQKKDDPVNDTTNKDKIESQDAQVGDDDLVAPQDCKACPICTVFNEMSATMCECCDHIFS